MNDRELELAQLLCTRLCHDLAGPVGAVAAGVELIGGDPAQADAETLSLIGNSSAAASLKLKFMRVALGASGSATGDPRALLDGYLDAVAGPGGKTAVTWPSADMLAAGVAKLGPLWVQLLLNLFLLALEVQPSCKSLSLHLDASNGLTVTIEARTTADRTMALREEILAAVDGRSGISLSARTVHSHLVGRLVRAAGGQIGISANGPVASVKVRLS